MIFKAANKLLQGERSHIHRDGLNAKDPHVREEFLKHFGEKDVLEDKNANVGLNLCMNVC